MNMESEPIFVIRLSGKQLQNLSLFLRKSQMVGDEAMAWVELMQLLSTATKEVTPDERPD